MSQAELNDVGTIRPVLDSNFTACMEQLQEGYVASIAATVGCGFNRIDRDNYGVDVLLVRPPLVATDEEVSIYAQLKNTTTIKPDPTKDFFSYQFKKREYWDHLAKLRKWPKAILVVMTTSPKQASWTNGNHDRLQVKYCCYWQSLEGLSVADGVKYPTVRIPTANVFNAEALTSILDRLDRGESLRE
ncbi:DUF4365 domain-containing protein [Actinomadura sp. HBU206391]|uniref:DUF4365 domain-containing protein n=1 Tax=Actinomadura sp. HBU206391 TaxID=2731692 RepID=UPI001650076C|nr:DUF4365 domain-containing protein [Actinomadura sp. HBU206391]MBC6461454.1 DUF4365 domain-containing protein [Actinomadura sp. HBU206391]